MSPPEATAPTSARIGIARLAEAVVAADPGVAPVRDSGRWVTRDGDRIIAGIVVAADGSGRVDVALHLVAFLPPRPLQPQAAALRAALVDAARRAGVAADLGEIDVGIHDLVAPEEAPVAEEPRSGVGR